MGFRDGLKRAFSSLGQEIKEKLPGTVSQMAQQTLEAMPIWDQGWAWRAQGNKTAQAVKAAVSENVTADSQLGEVKHLLTSIDSHAAAAAKSNAETTELIKRHFEETRKSQRPDPPAEGHCPKPA